MTVKTRIICTVSTILVAGVAFWLVIQRRFISELSVENQSLRAEVEQLTAQNERLTNATVQARGSQSLTEAELSELLRLRGEAGRLRKEHQELAKLREENQQLRAALPPGKGVRASNLAPEATYWPKDSWVFAGYATPESALQSLLWSASNGDMKSFLASTTGEAQKQLENDLKQKSEAELAGDLAKETAKLTSCRLLDKEYLPDDVVRLTLRMDGDHTETNALFLKKIGNEWKLGGDER
jgi:hypothetical protein